MACVAILSILVFLATASLGRAKGQARLVLCRNNLRALGFSLALYAEEHSGRFPVEPTLLNPHAGLLADLGRFAPDARAFYCPALLREDSSCRPENVQAGRIGYFYYSCQQAPADPDVSTFLRWNVSWPRRLCAQGDAEAWTFSDQWFSGEPTSHAEYPKGVNYLTAGGAVRFVAVSPRTHFR